MRLVAGLFIAVPAILSLTLPTGAQTYRKGMPAVLSPNAPPPPARNGARTTLAFRRAYGRQHRPRIAIFWNREFSDRLSQWIAASRTLSTRDASVKGSGRDKSGPLSIDATAGSAHAEYRQVSAPEAARTGMGVLADAQFEAGFSAPLLAAGVRLVDRSTIMRLTHGKQESPTRSGGVPDAQLVETDALRGYADDIAEIVMLPDSRASGGKAFRVVIKSIHDGKVIANLVLTADAPPSGDSWVAGPDGYEKAPTPPLSARALGRSVALKTMRALASAW